MSNPTPSKTSRLSSTVTGSDLVTQLRTTLDRAGELVRVLELNLSGAGAHAGEGGPDQPEASDAEHRLAVAESDIKELASRLVESEHQAGRLMNLYVATYQLHSTLDPAEVQETIAEISINLLGAEQFVLLLRKGEGRECEVALAEGIVPDRPGPFSGATYVGGDPTVDQTLDDGVLRFGPTAESSALAVVPLRMQDVIVGALVILKLLDHKPILRPEDRDLLDLLSAHAASAIFAARLFAAKDRKLRTLESLVKLARGE